MSITTTKNTQKKSSPERILKGLPQKEMRWVLYTAPDSTNFYTTSNKDRSMYFLYQETPSGFLLLKKAPTPVEFDEVIENWKIKQGFDDNEHREAAVGIQKPKRTKRRKQYD